MSSTDHDLIELTFVLVFILVGIIIHLRSPNTKPVTLEEIARKLGLKIMVRGRDKLLRDYGFINRLQYGHNQHSGDVLQGNFRGHVVTVLEMRYEVPDLAGKDHQDYYTFYFLQLPASLQEVTIYKEGLVSKLVQCAGHNDIDFESYEFSRKFRVRAADPKHAYDVCNARMIEYLLKNTDLSIEIDRDTLCISFNAPLALKEIEKNLNRLLEVRGLLPGYLFEEQKELKWN